MNPVSYVFDVRENLYFPAFEKLKRDLNNDKIVPEMLDVVFYTDKNIVGWMTLDPTAKSIFKCASLVVKSIPEGWKEKLEVFLTTYKKCARCWKYREEVGSNAYFPDLCKECIQVICTNDKWNAEYGLEKIK